MTDQDSIKLRFVYKGGPGSGHHGHSGRPGKRGGSMPGGGGSGGGSGDSRERQVTQGMIEAALLHSEAGENDMAQSLFNAVANRGADGDLMEAARKNVNTSLRNSLQKFSDKFGSEKRVGTNSLGGVLDITTAKALANKGYLDSGLRGYQLTSAGVEFMNNQD